MNAHTGVCLTDGITVLKLRVLFVGTTVAYSAAIQVKLRTDKYYENDSKDCLIQSGEDQH